MSIVSFIDRRAYPEYTDGWDDQLFRGCVLEHVRGSRVLEIGAGAGRIEQMNFRGVADRVVGIDPDPRVMENRLLDEARLGSAESIPYPDESFDIVLCNNVLEHLTDPQRVFSEVARVLRPGGLFLAKTPNRWHYVTLAARSTPLRFHRWYNRLRGRESVDTFPTCYRANSPRQVSRLAAASGLVVDRIRLIEGRPEYLRVSSLSYLLGLVYERLVNRIAALRWFRVLLIVQLRRPA